MSDFEMQRADITIEAQENKIRQLKDLLAFISKRNGMFKKDPDYDYEEDPEYAMLLLEKSKNELLTGIKNAELDLVLYKEQVKEMNTKKAESAKVTG